MNSFRSVGNEVVDVKFADDGVTPVSFNHLGVEHTIERVIQGGVVEQGGRGWLLARFVSGQHTHWYVVIKADKKVFCQIQKTEKRGETSWQLVCWGVLER